MNDVYPINRRPPTLWQSSDMVIAEPITEPADEQRGLNFGNIWHVVKTHRRLIIVIFLGAILTTLAVLLTMTPRYRAMTTVLIERNDPYVVDIKQVISEPVNADQIDYYKTQYAMLKSRSLAAEVIKQQELEKNPLFAQAKAGMVDSLIVQLKSWVSHWLPWSAASTAPASLHVPTNLVDQYVTKMLQVEPVNGTRLVSIGITSGDAHLSAQLANAHADAYARRGIALRSEASQEARRFLEDKLVELKQRVENSEAALNSYRKDKGIVSLDDKENVVVERLADLNKKLTEAEVERISLEAQVHLIRKRDFDSLPSVIGNSLISTLKDQLTRLQGEYASLSAQFKPGYPRLAQLKANMDEVQVRLKQEIGKIVGGLQSAYLAAQANERELRERTELQKNAAFQLKDASVNYAILNREAETNRQLYDSVVTRLKEVSLTSQLPNSNVVVIDPAEPPRTPTSPKIKMGLLLSALVGLLGGLGMAFLREQMDRSLKTAEDAERYLSLPNLGVVPHFVANGRAVLESAPSGGWRAILGSSKRMSVPEITFYPYNPQEKPNFTTRPEGLVSEAYRTLRTSILLSQAGEYAKSVLFTSAVHGEGKTDTTVNSAIKFAQTGARVLLIDADLRRPMCHKILGMRRGLGVAELLDGTIEPVWAIQSTHVDNLFFMASGASTSNPTELLGSRKMRDTLLWASQYYDHVLIDSPPVMAVSDAMLLSTMADGVVLVIGGQSTPRDLVKQACTKLRYARARILGMVLNRVDPKQGSYRDYRQLYESELEVATKA
jgi:capsular exopolysaccharide synthesis family protein